MKKTVFLISALIILAGLAGCDKIKLPGQKAPSGSAVEVRGTVIAKVANIPVTLEALDREIEAYNTSLDFLGLSEEKKQENKIDSAEKKINYLKNVVLQRLVFYQSALDRGMDRDEEAIESLERYKSTFLAEKMREDIVKNINVSSTQIEEAYNSVKDQLKQPEQRKIREIVAANEADANQIYSELVQGADFAAIAQSRSIANSKKDGGDLGFLSKGMRGEKFAAFDEVAFSSWLRQNTPSPVFKGPDGYYIVKIEAVKEGKQMSLADVQDKLKERLTMLETEKELENFYNKATSSNIKVEVYENKIK
ncbi:MAG: peptidyl-prolyl cis-trans isomerase [Candidatus Omnitrophica bacterium]|jgi:parvulin-like peptidyl-prolyl isomerase|nr:peptidyl-prolyl cis-trans isomerase [Candidatus Omnitrophota bacterium]